MIFSPGIRAIPESGKEAFWDVYIIVDPPVQADPQPGSSYKSRFSRYPGPGCSQYIIVVLRR